MRRVLAGRGAAIAVALATLAVPGCGGPDVGDTTIQAGSRDADASPTRDYTAATTGGEGPARPGLDVPADPAVPEDPPSVGPAVGSVEPGEPAAAPEPAEAPATAPAPEPGEPAAAPEPAEAPGTAPRLESSADTPGQAAPPDPEGGVGEVAAYGGAAAPESSGIAARGLQQDTAPEPSGGSGGTSEPSSGTAGSQYGGEARASGTPYTYFDGDVERTVWLLSPEPEPDQRAAGVSGDAAGAGQNQPGDDLVFVDESGSAMTLPGGVVLLLDPGWSATEVESFLSGNQIALDRATPLGWIDNGFLIETDPGLASLELANALATQTGVVLSSPNWGSEVVPR